MILMPLDLFCPQHMQTKCPVLPKVQLEDVAITWFNSWVPQIITSFLQLFCFLPLPPFLLFIIFRPINVGFMRWIGWLERVYIDMAHTQQVNQECWGKCIYLQDTRWSPHHLKCINNILLVIFVFEMPEGIFTAQWTSKLEIISIPMKHSHK